MFQRCRRLLTIRLSDADCRDLLHQRFAPMKRHASQGDVEGRKRNLLKALQSFEVKGYTVGILSYNFSLQYVGEHSFDALHDVILQYIKRKSRKELGTLILYLELNSKHWKNSAGAMCILDAIIKEQMTLSRQVFSQALCCVENSDQMVFKMISTAEAATGTNYLNHDRTIRAAIAGCSSFETSVEIALRSVKHLGQESISALVSNALRTKPSLEDFGKIKKIKRQCRVKCSVSYYNKIISYCRAVGEMGEAIAVFQNMPCPADDYTYSNMILVHTHLSKSYKDSHFNDACSFFNLSSKATPQLYSSMMTLFAKHEPTSSEDARVLYNEYKTKFRLNHVIQRLFDESQNVTSNQRFHNKRRNFASRA